MIYRTLQSFQVLQRDDKNKARVALSNGEIIELAVGGPYIVGDVHNILVGDLWILAGQSNMEGVGDLVDVESPSPFVHSYQSREQWAIAEEPLHWLAESPRVVHHNLWGNTAVPDQLEPRDPRRTKGSGLALTFAKEHYARTGVPIGLIPCAHGGTSMEQWDPALRDKGDASLYGAMLKRFESVGGKITGILWYQGESDANPYLAQLYADRMHTLIQAVRSDMKLPNLPFYYVQLGCFISEVNKESIDGWNSIRETQRILPDTIENIAVVSAIDLELDDLIHVGTRGLKRLGKRLAEVADGLYTPNFSKAVVEEDGLQLRITFKHVRGHLHSIGRPTGFSLHAADGVELPVIYKVTLDGDTAILHLTTDILPLNTTLWYGWGLNPYCNITDAFDAAILAFGPIAFT